MDVMEPGKWALQTLGIIESETRDLVHAGAVARWREAGHPLRSHSRSSQLEITPSSAENDLGSVCVPDQQSPQSHGQVRARTRRKEH